VWSALEAFPYFPSIFYGPGGRTHYLAKNLVVHVLVYEPVLGASSYSGRALTLTHPDDPTQRVSSAFAITLAHEFSHAVALLKDEYLEEDNAGSAIDNALTTSSAGVTNVVASPSCESIPWRHLLGGGPLNPSTQQLVGAFGRPDLGYHSEFKCLMNGIHDNWKYYFDVDLRTYDRFCNFCRELVVFRILERTGVLPEPGSSWQSWGETYRQPFFEKFGFAVPEAVPQTTSLGQGIYEACEP